MPIIPAGSGSRGTTAHPHRSDRSTRSPGTRPRPAFSAATRRLRRTSGPSPLKPPVDHVSLRVPPLANPVLEIRRQTIGIGSMDAGATTPTTIFASAGMNGDAAGIGAVTISTGSAAYARRCCRRRAGHGPRRSACSEHGNRSATAGRPHCQGGGGQVRCRLMVAGWGGSAVVVRGRESRPHGEGRQRVLGGCLEKPGGRR